jgi:toxin ParE1/3/4
MPLRARRLPQALIDGLDIWVHIAADNMTAADVLAERLDQAIERLSEYPELGPERPALGRGLRVFPVENIVIFYRVGPNELEIVRILHAARDVTPDMLAD